jgi:hypothetical protein
MHMRHLHSLLYQTGRSTTDTLQSGLTNCRLEKVLNVLVLLL